MSISCGGGDADPVDVPNNVYQDHSYNATPAQSLSAGSWQQVELNAVLAAYQYDTGGDIAVNTGAYTHTISEDGIYHLHGNVRFQFPSADITEVAMELRVNGVAVSRIRDGRQDGGGLISSVSGWVTHVTTQRFLEAGDVVTLWMKQENPTSAVVPIRNEPQYAHLVTSRIADIGPCAAFPQDIRCSEGGAPLPTASKIESVSFQPKANYGASTDGSPWPEVTSGDWEIIPGTHIGGDGAGNNYLTIGADRIHVSTPGVLIYRFVISSSATSIGKNIDFVEGSNSYVHQVRRVRPNGSASVPWGQLALQGSFGIDVGEFEFQERWIYTGAGILKATSRLYLTFIPG